LEDHQRPKDVARLPWLAQRLDGFDAIHVHFAGEAAEWAHALHLDTGIPYTVMVHATDLFRPRPSLEAVLGQAASVLTVADHHRDVLAARGIEARVLRCGPDLAFWKPAELPAGPLRALAVGRGVAKKGFDLLLAAWESMPAEARLTLVSDLQVPQLPAGVRLQALCPPKQVREVMRAANCFVLPCRRAADGDMDGVPVALMEAMACGRPVITTSVSGIPELVDDEVGWVLPPDDPVALVAALRAASAHELRAAKGRIGPARLRQRGFTLADQVSGLRSLLTHAVR
jgi:colanic acid/amylovoran biosynthesis glycosyltransferase